MTPDTIFLFAAGLGTRMAPLTDSHPKPMIEVAGRPLIDHALAPAEALALPRKVANLHYLPDMIRDHLSGRGVVFSDETGTRLETGGGLKAARPLLGDGPVFTMNTDAVWTGPNPLAALAAAWDPDRMDALLLCVPPDRAVGHRGTGDFDRDGEGRLARGTGLVYTGAQIIKPDLVAAHPEEVFSLNVIWDSMIGTGRLFGAVFEGGWCDVGRPESLPLAEALLETQDV